MPARSRRSGWTAAGWWEISSGASAPENLVAELVEFFRSRGVSDVSEYDVVKEDVRFMLPKKIREAIAAGAPEPDGIAGAG